MASMTSEQMSAWLRERIARDIDQDPDSVDPVASFDRLGIDSLALLGVIGDLAGELDIEIETSVLFDHPSIQALSDHLSEG
jgi:acyl carrier protein